MLRLNENEECCGSSLYDPIFEVCCNKAINVKFEHEKCCGTFVYNEVYINNKKIKMNILIKF